MARAYDEPDALYGLARAQCKYSKVERQLQGDAIVTAITRDDPIAIRRAWAASALACMGVVFGDIGTSPLYTLQVATKAASPSGTASPEAVLGIVSLIFWSLIIVISIKYAILIMRADNHGEGGADRRSTAASRP
jgi:hypothetical protein